MVDGKKYFLTQFHELLEYYEELERETKYHHDTTCTCDFYKNFLERFNSVFSTVHNPNITRIASKLRKKAEDLAQFDERQPINELATRMIARLQELGMELYALPEVEYILESSKEIELTVLLACCPEFQHTRGAIGCEGTLKTIPVPLNQDIQSAVRMYYEKYCRDCDKREKVEIFLEQNK